MIYTPSEMVETQRRGVIGIGLDEVNTMWHVARRAEQPDHPDLYEAVHPVGAGLLQEAGQPGIGGPPAYGLLQLLLAAGQDADYPRDGRLRDEWPVVIR
jgi:hypothetical protein